LIREPLLHVENMDFRICEWLVVGSGYRNTMAEMDSNHGIAIARTSVILEISYKVCKLLFLIMHMLASIQAVQRA
jgi:hypothetical protein